MTWMVEIEKIRKHCIISGIDGSHNLYMSHSNILARALIMCLLCSRVGILESRIHFMSWLRLRKAHHLFFVRIRSKLHRIRIYWDASEGFQAQCWRQVDPSEFFRFNCYRTGDAQLEETDCPVHNTACCPWNTLCTTHTPHHYSTTLNSHRMWACVRHLCDDCNEGSMPCD